MIRHLFTLIWNRKRANFLLILEIFLAFVVLFVVGSLLIYKERSYSTPLGFDYEQVWIVSLDPGAQPATERLGTQRQIIQRLRTLPGVRAVARSSSNTPFSHSHNRTDITRKEAGQEFVTNVNIYELEDAGQAVYNLHVQAGRWFDRRDDATRLPVLLSEDAQKKLFPHESAVGQTVKSGDNEFKVVGILPSFRGDGDLSAPTPSVFLRISPQDSTFENYATLAVRVQPGTGAELERQMTKEILSIGKGWTVGIESLPEQRTQQLKELVTPIAALVITSLFLIINVALGLFGVLWLNISRRRGEIGVRRAMGATAGRISGQVLGEILVLTTFGLVLGLLVAVQFPLLGVFSVAPGVYLTAMLLAAGLLYLLATVCALYPSHLAAGIQPAVALREE